MVGTFLVSLGFRFGFYFLDIYGVLFCLFIRLFVL